MLLVKSRLVSQWQRSPIHIWVQDRDEVTFEVEPEGAQVDLVVWLDGERAPINWVRFPSSSNGRWPVRTSRRALLQAAEERLIDRRSDGVYLYAERADSPVKIEMISQELGAALKALGYVQ